MATLSSVRSSSVSIVSSVTERAMPYEKASFCLVKSRLSTPSESTMLSDTMPGESLK